MDTGLLGSAITMVVIASMPVLSMPWLLTKIAALLVYIMLGMVAFRFAKNQKQSMLAWFSAILVFAFIVFTAMTKVVLFA